MLLRTLQLNLDFRASFGCVQLRCLFSPARPPGNTLGRGFVRDDGVPSLQGVCTLFLRDKLSRHTPLGNKRRCASRCACCSL